MGNKFNHHKHIIYSAILGNILIGLAILAYFKGFKYQWLLAAALILPVFWYGLKSKEYCPIKYSLLYSIYTTFPLFITASLLFLLSLLINPLGVMVIGKLLMFAFAGWISVFITFIVLNFCFVKVHKLLSKTKVYKNLSLTLFGFTHKHPFAYILVCFTIVASIGALTFVNIFFKNNRFLNAGISELMKKDSHDSKAIIYDKNKLLIVYFDKYEVFDLDKREKIKYGTIDGLKHYNGHFNLNPINDEYVLIIGFEYDKQKNDDLKLLNFGVLNLKDFSYKPLGEFELEPCFPDYVFTYDNRKHLIVTNSAKAYIFDGTKPISFPTEKWSRNIKTKDKLLPYKNKYLLIQTAGYLHFDTGLFEGYSPLIQEFNPENKTLKTLYKNKIQDNYLYLNTFLVDNNKLLIIYKSQDEEYKLRFDTIDAEKGEKIAEEETLIPDSEFDIRYAVMQDRETIMFFGNESDFRHGIYAYNPQKKSFDKTLYKANFQPDYSDECFVLNNGDVVIYKNIFSEGKITLFKNTKNQKQHK